jgi:hypothetical protein
MDRIGETSKHQTPTSKEMPSFNIQGAISDFNHGWTDEHGFGEKAGGFEQEVTEETETSKPRATGR